MNFPDFRPTQYGPLQSGTFPVATNRALSGRTSQTAFSDKETNITTALTFHLTTEEWQELITHFETKGTVFSFNFAPETLPPAYTLSGYRWRYTEPPQIADEYEDFFVVSCSFRSDFYSSFILSTSTLLLFIRPIETPPSFVPAAPPPAPTVSVEGLAFGHTNRGLVDVGGLQMGASWEYSLNGGSTWTAGAQTMFTIPEGTYGAGAIRVRQTNAAGAGTATQNAAPITVTPPNSITIGFSANAGATVTGTVALPRVGELLKITSSQVGWFRLYSSSAAAAADASRVRTVQVATAAGINADVIWQAPQAFNLWPLYDICNTETPQSNTYHWRFTNDGPTDQIVITLVYISKLA